MNWKLVPGKDLLANKGFDLLIVILGLTIAFQLNNLKENSDRNALENFYLESMLNDLDKDLLEYEDNLNGLKEDRRIVKRCLSKIRKSESVTDSLGYVVISLLSSKTFEGHQNTYATILGSNGITVIRDPAIRNLMMEHYRLYSSIARFETNYANSVLRVRDYFSLYLDLGNLGKVVDDQLMKNVQTRNVLAISSSQLQEGIWRYEGSVSKAKELMEDIKTYLNK